MDFDIKMKHLEEKIESAKSVGQERITNLLNELKAKCQELGQLKSDSNMKESDFLVF